MSFAHTQGGKLVFDTGRVQIGIRYEQRPDWQQSASADRIQAALIANVSGAPAVKPEGKPLAWTISDFFRRFL